MEGSDIIERYQACCLLERAASLLHAAQQHDLAAQVERLAALCDPFPEHPKN